MRSLVKAEFKKIWANPFVLVIIAGLLFFQGCMVFYTLNKKGEDNYSEADLASLYEEIRGLAAEEQRKVLKKGIGYVPDEEDNTLAKKIVIPLAGR